VSAEPDNWHGSGHAALPEHLHAFRRDTAELPYLAASPRTKASRDTLPETHRLPRCAHCADVIGVYEPMVMLTGSEALQTSYATQPDLSPHSEYFHSACHAQRQEDSSS